jgi:glc operon protein GlcG
VFNVRYAASMRAGAMFLGWAIGGTGLAFGGTGPSAAPPPLGQDAARRMAMQCLARSKSEGWPPFSIAIVDSSGALILFHREDGAGPVTAEAALLKARTSARAGIATRDMSTMSRDQPTRDLFILLQLTDDPGGVPVLRSGRVAGAVGVSGGSAEQDTGCAKIMVDAFDKS